MGRKPDPERRAELLRDVVGYLLDHGVHQTSLRPLASALKTSTYTFVYHFGTKEDLLSEALDEIAIRHGAAIEQMTTGTLDDFIRRYWSWNFDSDGLRTIRVVTDARSLARVQGELFRPFVRSITSSLQSAVERRLEHDGRARAEAPVITMALTGALADLASLDDASTSDETIEQLLSRVA